MSGLHPLVARDLVEYRKQHGAIKSRAQLVQMASVGSARYTQAAGFLIIKEGDNPFDLTRLHPESYALTTSLLEELGHTPAALGQPEQQAALAEKLRALPIEETSQRLGVGQPTLIDIIDTLCKPGHDPRDDMPAPIFRTGMLKLEELQPGQELKGTVLNVVDFGAFVDIGLKDSGLVHISQLANRYIKSPYDVVLVGDVVTVWVLSVDRERRRVSLTMISPGTERKPPERRGGRPPREEQQGERPQRGRRGRGDRQPQGERRPPADAAPAAAAAAPAESAAAPAASAPQQQAPPPRQDRQDRRGPPPQRRGQQGGRFQGPRGGGRQEGPRTPLPPRKPPKPLPKPKLTKDALQGRAPLRTFGELTAFYEAKDKPDEPVAPGSTAPAPDAPAAAPSESAPANVEASTPVPPSEPQAPAPEPQAAEA
ncbi:MAG: S1 RNA-binding domain-containing protein, partial [Gemmataceae bacterium]